MLRMNYSHVVDIPAGTLNAPQKLFPVAPRDIRARLDFPNSRKLMDMGFKKSLLAQVIWDRLASTGDDFDSFMSYFIAVKNAEQNHLSEGQVDTPNRFYKKTMERMSNPALITQEEWETTPDPTQPMEPMTNTEPSVGVSGSDSHLKRKKECNICMDAEADTVFMPCRHMCSCATCADKLANCAICRKGIEYCIKVFM